MILYDINDIELKIDKLDEKKRVVRRVYLEEPLKVGQWAYVGDTNNKIKRISEKEYMFIRKDSIDTHIEQYNPSGLTVQKVYTSINKKLDYELRYGDDRVRLVNQLIEDSQWIYNLKSSSKVIAKEIKKKNSFLAEDQKYDRLIDVISTYINHAKFKNEEDELKYNELVEKKKQLTSKKYLTSSEQDLLFKINDILSQYKNRLYPDELKNDYNEKQYEEKERKLNNKDIVDLSKAKDMIRKRYKNKNKFDINFWDKMGYSTAQKAFRNELINNYEQAIMYLEEYLGYNKSLEERSKIQLNLLKQFNKLPKEFNVNGKTIIITPKRRLKIYNDMYAQLKSDYKIALEKLTDQIQFKRLDRTSTEYNWNQDTWYINEDGEIVEISKNILSFSNPNTYKGLLLNYYDLKEKYKDRIDDDMWAILLDFENLLQKVKMNKLEKEICKQIMFRGDLKEVEKYIRDKYPNINKRKFYRYVDTYIPNKFKNTYIELIDEWLYTERLIGKWKQCSKCGEFKLINNDRYFRKRDDSADGFRNECRKCEISAKK